MNEPHVPRETASGKNAQPDLGPGAWDARYAETDIPWDMGNVSPPLVCFHTAGQLPAAKRVLVPGCGSGYEVAYLLNAGYEAVGVDFSPRAIEAARRLIGGKPGSAAVVADLLAPDVDALGVFDWAFDQTFFCAIAPHRRPEYARSMARLIAPGGQMLALSFRVASEGGPPFDSTPEEYIDFMQAEGLDLLERRPLDAESHPKRRGRETLLRMRRN